MPIPPNDKKGSTHKPDTKSRVDETQQRILETAFKVFSNQGYSRTTTRSLAIAAGVNEVTLFRHFGNKKNLFSAVVEKFGGTAVARELEAQLTGDYRRDMLAIGKYLMRIIFERKDAIRLQICEAEHFPEIQSVMAQNPYHLRRMLVNYFQEQIKKGRLRPLHPGAMAQAFMGMLFTYMITHSILKDPIEPEIKMDDLIAQFVDIFVEGTIKRI